ncbi:MAG: Na-translocating system protein MpsC family protein [Solirubrobacteraceae bacterium]
MTPAEKTLAAGPRSDAVTIMRHLYQETMEADFRAAVERITGRKVVVFIISGNHLDPDVASEVFVLDSPL